MRLPLKMTSLTALAFMSALNSSLPAAAQISCITTDSGHVVCGKPIDGSQIPNTPKNQKVEFEDISIILTGCKRFASGINCRFLLTAQKDGTAGFYCDYGKFFDLYGKEYYCERAQLGQAKGRAGTNVATRILSGISLEAVATFVNVPIQVNKIAALEIGIALSGSSGRPYVPPHRAVFRNILISP